MSLLDPKHRRAIRATKILVLTPDDWGVDRCEPYNDHNGWAGTPDTTPEISALADAGLSFNNAWGTPGCSPTRSVFETGKYPWREGNLLGSPRDLSPSLYGLPQSAITLPKLLHKHPAGWTCVAIGKDHLGGNEEDGGAFGGIDAPRAWRDWDQFRGVSGNLHNWRHDSYCQAEDTSQRFQWITNGSAADVQSVYITKHTADEAITVLGTLTEPWLMRVWFHAPHEPLHAPPSRYGFGAPSDDDERYSQMMQAVDVEIGRILDEIDDDVCIIFFGDNGTPAPRLQAPFSGTGKGTVYEPGIRIPLIIRHPAITEAGLAGSWVEHPVDVADLFPTIAWLAGLNPWQEYPGETFDGRPLLSYFKSPGRDISRTFLYSEMFEPAGAWTNPRHDHLQAARDRQYKLIHDRIAVTEEFYDLEADPLEASPLDTGNLSATEQASYDALSAVVDEAAAEATTAQWLRPDTDKLEAGNWGMTSDGGVTIVAVGGANVGASVVGVKGAVANTALISPVNPNLSGGTGRFRMSVVGTDFPTDLAGWQLFVSILLIQPLGQAAADMDFTLRLWARESPPTEVRVETIQNIPASQSNHVFTLTEAQAANFNDGDVVSWIFEFDKQSGGNCQGWVASAWLRTPTP